MVLNGIRDCFSQPLERRRRHQYCGKERRPLFRYEKRGALIGRFPTEPESCCFNADRLLEVVCPESSQSSFGEDGAESFIFHRWKVAEQWLRQEAGRFTYNGFLVCWLGDSSCVAAMDRVELETLSCGGAVRFEGVWWRRSEQGRREEDRWMIRRVSVWILE